MKNGYFLQHSMVLRDATVCCFGIIQSLHLMNMMCVLFHPNFYIVKVYIVICVRL